MKRFNHTESGDPERNGVTGIVDSAMNNTGMKAAYLAEHGISINDAVKTVRIPSMEPTVAKISELLTAAFGETVEKWQTMSTEEIQEKYGERIAEICKNMPSSVESMKRRQRRQRRYC